MGVHVFDKDVAHPGGRSQCRDVAQAVVRGAPRNRNLTLRHILVAQGSRAQIDKIAAGPTYSAGGRRGARRGRGDARRARRGSTPAETRRPCVPYPEGGGDRLLAQPRVAPSSRGPRARWRPSGGTRPAERSSP